MAKKSFKSGLDNLLASAGIKKKEVPKDDFGDKSAESKVVKEPDADTKHWLLIKNERLEEELALWRNGKLSVDIFKDSLKKHGLLYKAETNEIIEQ